MNLPIEGLRSLELETRVEDSKKPTVFWASARVVLRDGRELALSEIPSVADNLKMPEIAGRDFFGGPIKIVGTPHATAASGQPDDADKPGIWRLDLSGFDAVRFKATLGGDYPLGDETQRRRTFACGVRGKEARFLTVIEPYENTPLVRRVTASDPDRIRVELADGRIQEITLRNFPGDGSNLGVSLRETTPDGRIREEQTPEEDRAQK